MKFGKVLFITILAGMLFSHTLIAQEKSVEDEYLNQSVAVTIIREQAALLDRDSKLLALQYIREAIEDGGIGEEMRDILQDLALEGTLKREREEGRMANNYPDVRMRAAMYLGEIPTKESMDSLLKILQADNDQTVATEAIHSLTKIGINDNDITVNTIGHEFDRFEARMPHNTLNVLAIATIDALYEFGKAGSRSPDIYRIINKISQDYSYATTVRDYASKKFAAMRKNG